MKKLKKILLLLLVCVTLGTLTGCGEEKNLDILVCIISRHMSREIYDIIFN